MPVGLKAFLIGLDKSAKYTTENREAAANIVAERLKMVSPDLVK